SLAPEDEELDREYNHIDKLLASSHVRNWRPSEWRAMIQGAGLRILAKHLDFYTENGQAMDFDAWTQRMKTPAAAVEELRRLFRSATPALVEALRIEITGDQIGFCVPQIAIAATKEPERVARRSSTPPRQRVQDWLLRSHLVGKLLALPE